MLLIEYDAKDWERAKKDAKNIGVSKVDPHTKASIKLADGTYTNCTHQGEVTIHFTDDLGITQLLHLKRVLIVPDLDKRLFSVTQFSTIHCVHVSIHPGVLGFGGQVLLTMSCQKVGTLTKYIDCCMVTFSKI